jgi:hypothetical protein
VENRNSANHDLFSARTAPRLALDKESEEVSMLALHLHRSALVHINNLLPGHPE